MQGSSGAPGPAGTALQVGHTQGTGVQGAALTSQGVASPHHAAGFTRGLGPMMECSWFRNGFCIPNPSPGFEWDAKGVVCHPHRLFSREQ